MNKNLLFQRNELLSSIQKKIRKFFGRYLFTNFFVFFFTNKKIDKDYFDISYNELKNLKQHIPKKTKNVLSIGCGLAGFEVLLQNYILQYAKFFLLEKNFTSKKVVYGWDKNNKEAYNSIILTRKFINLNSINNKNFYIYNVDKDTLPKKKFDLIISLKSLDYHYPFDLYKKYLKTNSTIKTIFIFDTIRPDYFKKIFKYVSIISSDNKKIHTSKRLVCSKFI